MLQFSKATREQLTYWIALAVAVAAVVLIYWLLRSRFGSGADRDPRQRGGLGEPGHQRPARQVPGLRAGRVRLRPGRRVVLVNDAADPPDAAFSIGWTASIIFIVVIGGIGTIEGPIVGTILYFVLRETSRQYGSWYLIGLGLIAVVVMVKWPRGMWGWHTGAVRSALLPGAAARAARPGRRQTGVIKRNDHDRSLHLRRHPHPDRPLRRRAVVACAPTTSPRSRIKALMERHPGVDWARRRRRHLRLRQPGRRGQPQRRAHGGAARRAAGRRARRHREPAVRLGHGRGGHRGARDQGGRGRPDDRRRRREHDARAVRAWARPTAAFSRSAEIYDTTIGWRFVNPLMKAKYGIDSMPETAENVAAEFKVSRADQDAFAAAQPAAVARRRRRQAASPTRSCR